MAKKYIFVISQLSILVLFCISFLRGQELNSIPGPPFQNCWELSETIVNKVASDNVSKIFIPISYGTIKTLDTSKNEIWSISLGGEIIAQPIYRDKSLYILSKVSKSSNENIKEQDSAIYFISAVNTESGTSKWRKEYSSKRTPILFSQRDKLIIGLDKDLNHPSRHNLNLIILDAHTGDVILERNYDFSVTQYYNIPDENIVMLISTNSRASFSTLDGEFVSFNSSIENIKTGSAYSGGIILSDNKGILYFVDSTGKENRLKIRFGAKVTDIAFYNDKFLISSLDNFIYSVTLDGKQINWKKRFPGRVVEKPVISQNTIIAFSQGDSSLYFINFDDGKVFNRITIPDGEEIIGSPVALNSFVIVTTNKGIRAYSSDNCKKITATDKLYLLLPQKLINSL